MSVVACTLRRFRNRNRILKFAVNEAAVKRNLVRDAPSPSRAACVGSLPREHFCYILPRRGLHAIMFAPLLSVLSGVILPQCAAMHMRLPSTAMCSGLATASTATGSSRAALFSTSMKVATKPAKKGFGAKPKTTKKAAVIALPPDVASALEALKSEEQSIETYLNPKYTEDPEKMKEIAATLQGGDVVVLRDAFRPEFAEMVYAELMGKDVAWELNEAYFPDGYAHRHHNVYEKDSWSARLNDTLGVFTHAASKQFMSELTGRDCTGETVGAPSWYKEGDHSLPHTDWVGQRTVAYVWHLSKNWKPEWGGALYWAQHHHAVATYPASFNTLVLFSVTTTSAHFVTTVSPNHKGKRLTFNGWWQSAWVPSLEDNIEERLSNDKDRSAITHTQLQAISDLANDQWLNVPEERRAVLKGMSDELVAEFFPKGARAGIEA